MQQGWAAVQQASFAKASKSKARLLSASFGIRPCFFILFLRVLYCSAEGKKDGNTANALASFDASQASRSETCYLNVNLTT